MIKRLHLLVLKSFLGPFFLTFFIVIFVLVMQFLFKYINDLMGKGLELKIIAEFFLYLCTSMVPLALPLALLMSALMTFGNLGEFNELTALKSSGISLPRIMKPLIFLTLLICVGAFYFSNNVLPIANLKMRSLLYDIQRQRPDFQILEGIFYDGIEGYSIRIGERDTRSGMLYDLRIYNHSGKKGNSNVTYADSGTMKITVDEKYLMITLYHGKTYDEINTERRNRRDFTYPLRRDAFEEQVMMIEMKGFGLNRTDETLFKGNYNMLSLSQLRHFEDSILKDISVLYRGLSQSLNRSTFAAFRGGRGRPVEYVNDTAAPKIHVFKMDSLLTSLSSQNQLQSISQALTQARASMNYVTTTYTNTDSKTRRLRKYQIEIQRKFTLSFACFIFFFIGAPLGAIIRKGGLGMPTVISILFFIFYYIISLSGEKFARESIISPFNGMWISAVILFPLGIWLTYKAATDSAIMNLDTYTHFFRRFSLPSKLFSRKPAKVV